ncbi:unnamed protein product [Adineta ricciae]|uniref:Uncharacterized protein n=1 Tax=Adineta ricciae TaxID=249248 RepID=A0A815MK20_ADIRI|nr:unnamed protein product [Adineta ricciae]
MSSKKPTDSNQQKHWTRHSKQFNNESNDEEDDDDDVDDESEDVEMPSTLQDSSNESDDGVVVKDSGDESAASTDETGSDSDDEPPRRRAKRQPQVEPSPVQIYTAKSGRQWTSKEPPKRKIPSANILRQQNSVGRPAVDVQTVKEAFQVLITKEMVLLLVNETNRRAHLILIKNINGKILMLKKCGLSLDYYFWQVFIEQRMKV